jgi:cell division protein FtsB
MGQPLSHDHFPGENDYWHPEGRPQREPIPIRRWLLFLLLGVVAWELVFSPRGFLSIWRYDHERKELAKRREALMAEREELRTLKARLESGEAVEETAREIYGYARKGEEVYVLPVPAGGKNEKK